MTIDNSTASIEINRDHADHRNHPLPRPGASLGPLPVGVFLQHDLDVSRSFRRSSAASFSSSGEGPSSRGHRPRESLDGDPDKGKSMLTLDLSARSRPRCSSGRPSYYMSWENRGRANGGAAGTRTREPPPNAYGNSARKGSSEVHADRLTQFVPTRPNSTTVFSFPDASPGRFGRRWDG